MELVPLMAVIISALVLVLQIISLTLISGLRKSVSNLKDKESRVAPSAPARAEHVEKRDGEFRRHERRPYHEPRPRAPQAQPQVQSQAQPLTQGPSSGTSADQTEKSLRDINLRLKNAERDQESARRKVQENFSRGGGDHRSRSRDDRDHRDRGNRDRDRNRDFGNRNQRYDNWRDRNKTAPTPTRQQSPEAPAPEANDASLFEKNFPVAPPEIQTSAQPPMSLRQPSPETSTDPNSSPSDFNSEELEHGRKIVVKRRPLRDDAPESNGALGRQDMDAPAAAGSVNTEEETTVDKVENVETDIQFGRR